MIINGHSHLLPYPEEIPTFMKDKKLFWIDKHRNFMHQNEWKRPITDKSFFLKEKIEWMDQNKIDHAVVLTLSQLYGNGLSYHDMDSALRFQNDFNAKVQAEYPNYFTCGFVVNAAYIDWSVKEMERNIRDNQLKILCLPTHYLSSGGRWKTIFNEEAAPIFHMADRYGLAVEIHPYDGEKFIHLENRNWRFHLVWMLAQCADAYHFYTLQNYPNKYPNIRVCFAHGSQLSQMNIGRRVTGFDGRPDLFEGMAHPNESLRHPNIYFDSLVHDILSLEFMIKRLQGTDQIIFGLDDPYPLGDMNNIPVGNYPGKLLDQAKDLQMISESQLESIKKDNVLRWLGIDEEAIKN